MLLNWNRSKIHLDSRGRNRRSYDLRENIDDHETLIDEKLLEEYKVILTEKGFQVETKLGARKNAQKT
jgi:hypothetical protein